MRWGLITARWGGQGQPIWPASMVPSFTSRRGFDVIGLNGLEGFGIITTFLLSLAAFVLSVVNKIQQSKRDAAVADVAKAQLSIDQRLADITFRRDEAETAAARRAALRFRLVSEGNRFYRLEIGNHGKCDASTVVILGDHSSGQWRTLGSASRLAAGDQTSIGFTNHEWQVLGGLRIAVRYRWTDADGEHEDSTTATVHDGGRS